MFCNKIYKIIGGSSRYLSEVSAPRNFDVIACLHSALHTNAISMLVCKQYSDLVDTGTWKVKTYNLF